MIRNPARSDREESTAYPGEQQEVPTFATRARSTTRRRTAQSYRTDVQYSIITEYYSIVGESVFQPVQS